MAYNWPNAFLIRINKGEDQAPNYLANKAIIMDEDIVKVLHDLASYM